VSNISDVKPNIEVERKTLCANHGNNGTGQNSHRLKTKKPDITYQMTKYLLSTAAMAEDKILRFLVPLASKQTNYIWGSIYGIEATLIIIINAITILTFSTNKNVFNRAVYMLINLSVADMLFGCSIFFTTLNNTPNIFGRNVDTLKINSILETLTLFCLAASGLGVLVVAADRAFATLAPFHYRATNRRYYATIIGIDWCSCLCVALTHYFIPSKYVNILLYCYIGTILGFLFTIITLYTMIFIKVRSQGQLSNRNNQIAQQRERSLAYTLMIVTFCSLLTWVPIGIVVIINQTTTVEISVHVTACALLIQISNSFINPVIYAFRMKDFRKASLKLLCKCPSLIHPNN